MSYAQDTITSADAANALATALDALFVDAGWETIETLTPSGNYRNRVYKSNAADNLCGYDWFVVMTWTTVGSERYVDLWAGSDYNPTTKVLSHIAAGRQVESIGQGNASDSTGAFAPGTINASTYTPGTSAPVFNAYGANSASNTTIQTRGFHTLTPSSAFAYWASITLDHVAVFTTVAANAQSGVYSTLDLDPIYAADTSFRPTPIVAWDTTSFAISDGLIGPAGAVSSGNYRATKIDYSRSFGSKLPALADEYEVAYAWRPAVYVDSITGSSSFQDTSFRGGYYMGEAFDIYMVWGGSIGDTVTIDGGTYVLTMPMDPGSVQPCSIAVLVEA